MDSRNRPELFDFHGVPMTREYTENWVDVQNFKARPDDIIIASYPKSGNTWLSYIMDLLYNEETRGREKSLKIFQRVHMLESTFHLLEPGTEMLNKLLISPRLIKTHLPVHFLPKSFWDQNCRIIYVARNAKDIVVSYFNFERMTILHPEPGDWSSYLHRFMEGKLLFGSWYDHVSGWWRRKQTYPHLHFMFYEDLIEDTKGELDKLCSFLGLSPSDEDKEEILHKVHFDEMKKNEVVNHATVDTMDFKISPFMRKGKVGDWKNHFTVAQNEEFDKVYKEKMKNSTLCFRTEI
ncbi:cytosolic sulfotransferase 1-like [Halichoeres trimaculatus]|uniref:cytosolic sulfotransferase 1-like n=1 Tax=Halichoeres trimaculatus TaxID=147232 RepID=UPI003D9DE3FD